MAEVFSGKRISRLVPGSAEWMAVASASKVAAMIGISPFESKFSLWHKMRGNVPPETGAPDPKVVEGGNYLEPSVVAWWADQHPEYRIETGGTWARKDNARHVASPDRMAQHRETKRWIALEVKTARFEEDWGEEFSDDVPVYYLVQALWQMHVLGIDEIVIPVLGAFFTFSEYVVRREDHAEDIIALVEGVEAFLRTLETGEQPDPTFDNSTYVVLRQLHPEIEIRKETVGLDLAHRLTEMLRQRKAAEEEEIAVKVLVAEAMGTAKTLWYPHPDGDVKLGHRQTNGRGANPYFVPARNLRTVKLIETTTTPEGTTNV